ncbi:MAG: type II toxin-antitoxin system VapC family toxin [Hormoscilla sp. SP5CHS1]|nr:type II toxin-antitoxin system VapC family toxin [Hormoscilla sp. SP5CHS1]
MAIRRRLQAIDVEEVAVCSIVKAELFYGAMRSNNPEQTLARQEKFLRVFEPEQSRSHRISITATSDHSFTLLFFHFFLDAFVNF